MAKFRQMISGSSSETRSADRTTGWFPITDIGKSAFIRRINARHVSSEDLTITLYTDGDSSISNHSIVFRANSGDTGVDLSTTIDNAVTSTTIATASTTLFKNGDWIKIDDEIMKVIIAGTTSHIVQRAMRGTAIDAHTSGTDIYYANYPNDSIRIGKRAKYAQVKITAASSTNDVEINKLEIEYT